MTIKELEEKTGLARANIRYYEQQGLVHPARQENGYRDYSGEDLQTLRKIKLLRHLGLGIETIRTVQRGEQTLEEALAAREEELEKEAAMLGKEKTVCRELRQRQIGYDALEPETYLLELERQEAAAPGALAVPRPEQGDIIKPLQHPWRRFFARNLDWAICGWLWQLVGMGTLGINGSMEPAYSLLGWCMALLLMLALEPVLLSRLGTTPGKWLFGLQVRNIYGEKLSYDQALRRTWMVLLWGMGLNIAAVNVYFNWKSYEKCMAGKPAVWDENTSYTIRDTKTWRILVCLFIYAAIFVGAFWYAAQKSTPHSAAGDLTREEFIAACNESVQLDDDPYHLFLDGNGNWQLTEQTLRENPNALAAGYGAEMDYEILLDEEQHVEGVRITIEDSENEEVYVDDLIRQTWYSYEALRSSRRSFWGALRVTKDYYDQIDVPAFFETGGSAVAGNVRIDCVVENVGMEMSHSGGYVGLYREIYDGYVLRRKMYWNEEKGTFYHDGDISYACTVTLTYDS